LTGAEEQAALCQQCALSLQRHRLGSLLGLLGGLGALCRKGLFGSQGLSLLLAQPALCARGASHRAEYERLLRFANRSGGSDGGMWLLQLLLTLRA
jgi:hypothetical protein